MWISCQTAVHMHVCVCVHVCMWSAHGCASTNIVKLQEDVAKWHRASCNPGTQKLKNAVDVQGFVGSHYRKEKSEEWQRVYKRKRKKSFLRMLQSMLQKFFQTDICGACMYIYSSMHTMLHTMSRTMLHTMLHAMLHVHKRSLTLTNIHPHSHKHTSDLSV